MITLSANPPALLEAASLAKMPSAQLWALFEALRTLDNTICGLSCQPRYRSDRLHILNDAGEVLATLGEMVTDLMQDIVARARIRVEGESEADADRLSWIIIGYEAGFADSISNFSLVAAEAAQRVEQASGGRNV